LQAFLRDPAKETYGLELSEETGLQPGTAVQASAALSGARRPKGTALQRLAEGGGTA
jgi:hypothetical protein